MTVSDTIRIEAPPEIVWRVTTEVERWPEWTPTVTAVTRLTPGDLRLGSVVRIKQPAQPEAEWEVVEFEPFRRFAWATRRVGLQMVGIHALTPEGQGTANHLQVVANGPLVLLLRPVLRRAMRRALVEENRGLKVRCERMAQAGSF